MQELFSFTVFQGKSMKDPETWDYGAWYDSPSRNLILFLTDNGSESLEILIDMIKFYLEDTIVDFGYLYYCGMDYALGSQRHSLGLYKENNNKWWEFINPRNRDCLFDLNGKIRHVYTLNLIREELLYYSNNSFDFYSWVNNGHNGSLEKISKRNWLWKVPAKRLHEIGKVLYEQKLLLGVDN